MQDGYGFLRGTDSSYLAGTDDVYISPSQIRRFALRTGDSVPGRVRSPKDNERYFVLLKVDTINIHLPDISQRKGRYENLTVAKSSGRDGGCMYVYVQVAAA